MNKYDNIMVDIETMGLPPDGAILTVGLVPFSLHSGGRKVAPKEEWFYAGLSLEANEEAGREINADTLRWWMDQSETARKELFRPSGASVKDAECMCALIQKHVDTFAPGAIWWAKPPTFDLIMLEHLFKSEGRSTPWNHWQLRDVRTVYDCLREMGKEQDLAIPEIAHRADHDAAAQAENVIQLFDALHTTP